MIDYSEELKTHSDYVNIINKLETKTKKIEMVIIDGKSDNNFIKRIKNNIISKDKVSHWWENYTCKLNYKYVIKPSKKVFDILRDHENFLKILFDNKGNVYDYQITDFGIDDIAFFDEDKKPLLCTTIHEGKIYIRSDLL